ncbi:hypothetical protein LCGC14_3118780, partial [marine sediment metagenome]
MKLASLIFAISCSWAAAGPAAEKPPYKDDPAIIKMLDGLGDNSCLYLPPMKTAGEGMGLVSGFAKRGPGVRDYGNKMVYAPERGTAMYCGANHGVPSRLNDASDVFHYQIVSFRFECADVDDHIDLGGPALDRFACFKRFHFRQMRPKREPYV